MALGWRDQVARGLWTVQAPTSKFSLTMGPTTAKSSLSLTESSRSSPQPGPTRLWGQPSTCLQSCLLRSRPVRGKWAPTLGAVTVSPHPQGDSALCCLQSLGGGLGGAGSWQPVGAAGGEDAGPGAGPESSACWVPEADWFCGPCPVLLATGAPDWPATFPELLGCVSKQLPCGAGAEGC